MSETVASSGSCLLPVVETGQLETVNAPRSQLPRTRHGTTRKMALGKLELYITIHRDATGAIREIFCKVADRSRENHECIHQGEADGLCMTASPALQHGTPLVGIIKLWRLRRYHPQGNLGEPHSLSDALATALNEALPEAERLT